jgi:predicted RNA-binding Zn-ribbon protein involved in translation (DUF1610 family)
VIIKEIIEQHRRDFTAIYLCEHCGYEQEGKGYDDANFHNNVVPKKVCPSCGEVASTNYRPMTTKYPKGMQV